ncbi:hypothetical protein LTR37_003838 [Vermiconidia calcicola]|uniref:Uncharacterized protein n=1 Tax=Vermiconidia calcicola TaxID=1690605 RepID=A0ACC3NQN3_9PEZI|nr:hypothetical protein LTR37_003838 [Vermiconidia calcicola]
MPKEFFSGWPTWEKLVFILACAIVVTVFLGCLKLAYTDWRLRKYSAVAEREKQEQTMHRQMSQRTRRSGRSEDVPFGVRAIESGIEVEGVWISRANTPEASPRTSAASSTREQAPRIDFDADVERQGSRQSHARVASDSATISARQARSSLDRAAEKQPIRPPRSRHPPLSYTRYNCQPYHLRQSSSANTLEGLDAIHKASTSMHSESGPESSDSSNQSSDSTGDIEPISASAPGLLTAQPRPRPRQQSIKDLELLNSHRISQAAETGQLTPRGRRPGQSYSVDFTRQSRSTERTDYFGGLPNSTRQRESPTNPFATPKIETLPSAARRSSMPNVTPFAEFCKRASNDARPGSLRSSSRDSAQSPARKSDSHNSYDSGPPSPIMPASEGAAAMKLPPPKRTSFEKRPQNAQVLRGHGTGFEILKTGSLNPPLPREHPMERQRAAPPLSLHNATRTQSGSAGSRNKLRKKPKQSFDSSASSNSSRQSRISLF